MCMCARIYTHECVCMCVHVDAHVCVCMYVYNDQLNCLIYTADNARTRLSQTDDESDYVNSCYIDVSLLLNYCNFSMC